MHILGIKPSHVILSQIKEFKKLKNDTPKVSKHVEASIKGWCNKNPKLQFQSILKTENWDALKTRTNQAKSIVDVD